MACRVIATGGVFAIACGPRGRAAPCCVCRSPSTQLCDWPLKGPKEGHTCDKPLCKRCAVHIADEVDFCPGHAKRAAGLNLRCSVCREPQFPTKSGDTCKNGHGGAPPMF